MGQGRWKADWAMKHEENWKWQNGCRLLLWSFEGLWMEYASDVHTSDVFSREEAEADGITIRKGLYKGFCRIEGKVNTDEGQ